MAGNPLKTENKQLNITFKDNLFMKTFFSTLLLLIIISISSCTSEKDKLITAFDNIYADVLAGNYSNIEPKLNDSSHTFYNKVTNSVYLNIDSIIVLGEEYRLPFMLTEYLAFNGDKIKEGESADELYRYLGSQEVSFFSFQDAYYVDAPKLKKGKENFVSIIREEMSQSKRGWVQFTGNESSGYELDLLYTLQLHEIKLKKKNKALRAQHQEQKTLEEYLRFYYWQNSGKNTSKFENEQLVLEENLKNGRAELIQSYIDRGLMESKSGI